MSLTLGFDTSTTATAVAVVGVDGSAVAERWIGPGEGGRPLHGPALLPAVIGCVEEVGGWSGVDRLAVGIGPGSFTGIRIGIATAKALAQGRDLPLAGVSSTAALAAGIAAAPEAEDRAVLAIADARRGEVFVALGRGAEVSAPVVCEPTALRRRFTSLSGALAAGEGAVRFRAEIEMAGVEVLADDHPAHRLSARHTASLGAEGAGDPLGVRPQYLRRPDAERWLERDRRN